MRRQSGLEQRHAWNLGPNAAPVPRPPSLVELQSTTDNLHRLSQHVPAPRQSLSPLMGLPLERNYRAARMAKRPGLTAARPREAGVLLCMSGALPSCNPRLLLLALVQFTQTTTQLPPTRTFLHVPVCL